MTITPVNGTILVQQGNREFNKLYEKYFRIQNRECLMRIHGLPE